MKLLLLRVLLQRRNRDEGFTLPMVIALGLVMILLGTTNIVKSSEENLNASIQNSSSDAMAVAEVGITKYRELLNQNRILTIYNHDQWDTNATVTGQVCNDMASAPEDSGGNPIWTGTATKPNDTGANDWWNVSEDIDGDGTDELIGQYRLVSYVYDNDGNIAINDNGEFNPDNDNADTTDYFDFNNGTYDTKGVLTVQGESPDGSQAQIQVEIPLRINDLDNFEPVLWVADNTISAANLNNVTVSNGNVVIKDSATSSANGCGDFSALANGASRPVISDPRIIPSIDRVKNIINEAGYASQINTTYTPGEYFGKKTDTDFTFDSSIITDPNPAAGLQGECASATDYCFFYSLGSLTIDDTNALADGITNIKVYVNGTVDIDATAGLSDSEIIIGSDTSSDYFELYVDNGNAINIDVASGKTVTINGFIHAPTSTLTISGAGTVNINGAVWVGDFVNNNTTVNITGDETDTATGPDNSYKFYTTSTTRTPRPLTSSPNNWIREEVN